MKKSICCWVVIGCCSLLGWSQTKSEAAGSRKDSTVLWQAVQVIEITTRDTPKNQQVLGENVLAIAINSINALSDLSEQQLTALQKDAANHNATAVYVDVKGVFDSAAFPPLQSQGKLYYYYCKPKKD
jgi:hypothetical protein